MDIHNPHFNCRLARDDADIAAAQRLRYEVFVRELGATGPGVDHDAQVETDPLDAFADHLMLLDRRRHPSEQVVGVYRLLRDDQAEKAGRFGTEAEYDLAPLLTDGRPMLELGRACLHRDMRGGAALLLMWQALAAYVDHHRIGHLFGAASFPGRDLDSLVEPLSYLHHHHALAPEISPQVIGPGACRIKFLPPDAINRRRAIAAMPALLRAYLRLGGAVGSGAYLDRDFNCVDVFLALETAQLSARHRMIYAPAAV